MIGFYNYSVILTYIGLFSGIIGMVQALEHNPRVAVLCLMVCGLCDMFDGAIARKCKRSEDAKCFGTQIDSLCDLVCFGVFPAFIGYAVGITSWFGTFCMAFYVLAAVIRLGYFNVQEIARAKGEGGRREYYEGMPVTTVALVLPIVLLIDALTKFSTVRFYNIALILLGTAFITRFRVKKPYMIGLGVLAAVGLAVFLLVYRYGGAITCLRDAIASV